MYQRTGGQVQEHRTLIIIPAYNEAPRIGGVIANILQYVPNVDVLVVDEGSLDGTGDVVRATGAELASLPFNMGYGVALQTGFKYAARHNYDYVIQIDADGQHEPSCIPVLLDAVQDPEVDVVLGSRWLGLAEYEGPRLR